ncbi:hypothetical protein [Sphingomonas sp. M1-B02]|uniref:hypothetical protein n=1 Tax=Sphingomonas sp. M1-B02 TaxID=3114300 RepID=UPI0022403015|nr:hypothetical protein [Sphingomonas sp. S6-11]UZK67025.1 hypothetical protein OKW87_04125 [Sphingomonas sp. S6-11]
MRTLSALTLGLTAIIATSAQAQSQTAQPATPAPAAAAAAATQGAPSLTVGAKVYDAKEGEVGTIESIVGGNAVVATGTEKVTLPPSAFAQWPKGLVIALTRDELNAAAAKARADNAAALVAALKPGAEVRSVRGTALLGTVKSVVGEEWVVLTLADKSGDLQLPRKAFIMTPAGLALTFTADEFDAAVKASKPQPTQ